MKLFLLLFQSVAKYKNFLGALPRTYHKNYNLPFVAAKALRRKLTNTDCGFNQNHNSTSIYLPVVSSSGDLDSFSNS